VRLLLFLLFLVSCQSPLPKPKGMLALTYPEPSYTTWLSSCPFEFPRNVQTNIDSQENCFFNIDYPQMNARVYMSYFDLEQHNYSDLWIDVQTRLMEHNKTDVRIKESSYQNTGSKVYGRFFELQGDAPSNLHFVATDQDKHFLTGVLFFKSEPNYDSLYPAIQYVKTDMRKLTEDLSWR